MSDLAPTLARLSALLGDRDGPPEPLEGGITNRNFRVSFGGVAYVLRLPGKDTELLGIDRKAEWAAAGVAARTGVGPKLGAMLGDPPCLVTRFIEGRPLSTEELGEPAMLGRFATALRSIHDSGEQLPATFSPFRVVETYAATSRARGADVPAAYDAALEHSTSIEAALHGPEHEPVPCHNDLLPANLLYDGAGVRMIDWEYAGMGDRYFDSATSPSTTSWTNPGRRHCSRPTSASRPAPAATPRWG